MTVQEKVKMDDNLKRVKPEFCTEYTTEYCRWNTEDRLDDGKIPFCYS